MSCCPYTQCYFVSLVPLFLGVTCNLTASQLQSSEEQEVGTSLYPLSTEHEEGWGCPMGTAKTEGLQGQMLPHMHTHRRYGGMDTTA